jgi:excisionase family DNA binding protein
MENLLSVKEVAERLNVSKRTIYSAVKQKKLAAFIIGNQLRFSNEQVQQYLNSTHLKLGE